MININITTLVSLAFVTIWKFIQSKEERECDRRAQEAIKRADDVIARTEKLLEDLEK